MAYSAPSTVSTGDLCTASTWNQDVVANPIAIYAGAMSVTSQAVGDILYASSTTQLGRIAAVATGQVLTSAGTGTVPAWSSNVDLGGTLDVTGATTLDSTLGVVGAVTFNDAGADVDFRVESDDNQNMLFVDGGEDRVGIGTGSPQQTLHIERTNGPHLLLSRISTGISFTDGTTLGHIEIGGQDADSTYDAAAAQIIGQAADAWTSSSHPTEMLFTTTAASSTSAAERMRINEAGQVAIGIATPDGTLHVHTATAGSVTAGGGADDLVVENSTHAGMTFLSPSGDYQQTIAFGDVGDADSGRIVYDHDSNQMQFWTEGAARMYIDSAGDVGIGGAPAAGYQFHVTGWGTQDMPTARFDCDAAGTDPYKAGIVLHNDDETANSEMYVRFDFTDTSNVTHNDGGGIGFKKEQAWTSTASTQDSFFSLGTTLNGTLSEKMRVTSGGNAEFTGTMTATQYLTGVSSAISEDGTTNLYASSGASGSNGGMIAVRDGYSRFALFWYGSYDSLTKIAGNAVYTATKDNASTINIYYESGNIVYQNKTTIASLSVHYTRILG